MGEDEQNTSDPGAPDAPALTHTATKPQSMDVHERKRGHNWRQFLGEIGIVVLGVLIALAGEQVVDGLRTQQLLNQYRNAAYRELAFNLAAYEYRIAQSRCVERRISELTRWRTDWQNGYGKPLDGDILRPSITIMRTSVRNSAPNDVLTDMPLEQRLRIAGFYDALTTNQDLIYDEREAWRSLGAFNHATVLTHDDLMRLDELIYRVRSINRTLASNSLLVHVQAKQLNIEPSFGSDNAYVAKPDVMFCRSIIGTRSP